MVGGGGIILGGMLYSTATCFVAGKDVMLQQIVAGDWMLQHVDAVGWVL